MAQVNRVWSSVRAIRTDMPSEAPPDNTFEGAILVPMPEVDEDWSIDESTLPASTRAALRLAGAWSDLDGDEMLDALERMRNESKPSPPFEP